MTSAGWFAVDATCWLRVDRDRGTRPRLLVDLEVEGHTGAHTRLGTDKHWLGHPGLPPDWLDMTPNDPSACSPVMRNRRCSDPALVAAPPVRRSGHALVGCAPRDRRSASPDGGHRGADVAGLQPGCTQVSSATWKYSSAPVVFLALVPATVGIAAAVLATYDPRIARQDVYQLKWVLLAAASVLAQWGFLRVARRRRGIVSSLAPRPSPLAPRLPPSSLASHPSSFSAW